MGTTCSSGLNNALSNSVVAQTTLPSWYSAAQQNIVSGAQNALNQAPSATGTTLQNSVNNLNNQNNAFRQGQSALNTIASGAANPWITCSTTGAVNPNTNTAMGGLFAAERQQLNQLLPTTIAPCQANAVASGNFGSLRGQTAVDTAKTNAFDTLAAQQMTAALNNQSTGATAAANLGNIGAQCNTAQLATSNAQYAAPFNAETSYANLINAVKAPGTQTTQTQLSGLNTAGAALKSACTAIKAGSNILCQLGIGSSKTNACAVATGSGCGGCFTATPGNSFSLSGCKAGGLVGRKR
jgi:hypothetical protein